MEKWSNAVELKTSPSIKTMEHARTDMDMSTEQMQTIDEKEHHQDKSYFYK
jgi:hypothetical protein